MIPNMIVFVLMELALVLTTFGIGYSCGRKDGWDEGARDVIAEIESIEELNEEGK